jgi:endonuclease YncB( thermonuclease family)
MSYPLSSAASPSDGIACPVSLSGSDYDEIAQVKYVYDGDTLTLRDGRKVRLIGINTPEMGRKGKPHQPYSIEAKNALKSLFTDDKPIRLLHGIDDEDRYGRMLAHGFLDDGQNIQSTLLNQGLASAIMISPNTRFASCYLEQERTARCAGKGIWKKQRILEAGKLKPKHKGFQIVRGKVKSINSNSKGIWINLEDKLTIGIRPDNRHLFDLSQIKGLLDQPIIVRGWINKSSKSTPYYLRVRHPSSIQTQETFDCR